MNGMGPTMAPCRTNAVVPRRNGEQGDGKNRFLSQESNVRAGTAECRRGDGGHGGQILVVASNDESS